MKKSSTWLARGVAVVALLGLLAGTTRAERRIYWCVDDASPSRIERANLDGAAPETFVTTPCFGQVVVDGLFTRDVFFANGGENINRVSVDGGSPTGFINFPGRVIGGLTLDLGVNGPLYFVGNPGGPGSASIWRTDLDGNNITFILNTAGTVLDLELDFIGNKLYWVEADGIHRADQNGTNHWFIGGSGVQGIAVDSSNGVLYFTDDGNDLIWLMNLSSFFLDIILHPSSVGLAPKDIDLDGLGRFYWFDANSDTMRRADVNGTNVTTIADLGGPFGSSQFIGLEVGFFSCGRNSPFGDVNESGSANFADISLVVDCFRNINCSNATFNRADLNPCSASGCIGDGLVNFADISRAVDAFRNLGCI